MSSGRSYTTTFKTKAETEGISKMQQHLKDLHKSLVENKQEQKALSKEITAAEKEIQRINKQIEKTGGATEEQKKRLEELNRTVSSGKDALEALKLKQSQLQSEINDTNKKIEEERAALEKLKQSMSDAKGHAADLVKEMGAIGAAATAAVADIVNKLCVDAGLGYSMAGRILDSSTGGFSFRLRKGVDRTINQNNNAYVIFGSDREKVVELSFDHSVSTLLNYVYAEDSNKTVDEVSRYADPATYIDRRECTISVGISTGQETSEYFDSYVLNEIADNIETHSCEVATAYSDDFGSRYDLGDKVSILDRFTGNVFDMVITSAEKSCSCGQSSLKLTFGRPKDKPLDRIVNSFISGTARRQ